MADLTAFALQAACWGDPDASGLALLDPPPAGAMAAAREVLTAVGAVDAAGRATDRGVRMARLGLHPRLARALLDGAAEVGARRAAEVVALLSEEPPREYGDDLAAAPGARARRGRRRVRGPLAHRRPAGCASRRRRGTDGRRRSGPPDGLPRPGPAGGRATTRAAGLVAALAFPERVARARAGASFLMVVRDRRAELGDGFGAARRALARGRRRRPAGAGRRHARVRLAAVVDEDTARPAAGALRRPGEEVRWADGDVVARRVERLGAVELAVRPLRDADPGLVRAALLEGLRQEGLGLLRWSRGRARRCGSGSPSCTGALGGAVARRVRRRRCCARAGRVAGARAEPGPAAGGPGADRRRAGAAPAAAVGDGRGGPARRAGARSGSTVPSGSQDPGRLREPEQPVLAVKLQELFGLRESPAGRPGCRVLVHLLSPAGRPAAVTADLASFWRDGYRRVRAELRGRYPKHPWPEDPATAEPTRHTNARLRR